MLSLYKIALGPVLLVQAFRLRKNALRLPEPVGPRIGSVGEKFNQELSVLFLGDSSAAGVGVTHQREALALQTANILASRIQRFVRWQLLAQTGVNAAQARDLVNESIIERADVLVTSLGTNDVTSQQSPRVFAQNYIALLDETIARSGAKMVVITGLPPLRILPAAPQPLRWYLGKYARRLDERLRRMCSQNKNFSYLSLDWAAKPEEMAIDRYHPGKGQYAIWSDLVCVHIEQLLMRIGHGASAEQ